MYDLFNTNSYGVLTSTAGTTTLSISPLKYVLGLSQTNFTSGDTLKVKCGTTDQSIIGYSQGTSVNLGFKQITNPFTFCNQQIYIVKTGTGVSHIEFTYATSTVISPSLGTTTQIMYSPDLLLLSIPLFAGLFIATIILWLKIFQVK